MKKILYFFLLVILFSGTGCVKDPEIKKAEKGIQEKNKVGLLDENKSNEVPNDVQPTLPQYFYLDVSNTSTVITRSGSDFRVEIPELNFKTVAPDAPFIYREGLLYIYIGVRTRPVVGYERGLNQLYQINIKTKKVVSLQRKNAYIAAVSPDDTWVAYTIYEPIYEIFLKNLKDNSEKRIAIPNKNIWEFIPNKSPWKFGDVYFSPDSKKLVYAVLEYQTPVTNSDIIGNAMAGVRVVDITSKKFDNLDSRFLINQIFGKGHILRVFGWKDNQEPYLVGLPIQIIEFTGKQGDIKPVQFEGCAM